MTADRLAMQKSINEFQGLHGDEKCGLCAFAIGISALAVAIITQSLQGDQMVATTGWVVGGIAMLIFFLSIVSCCFRYNNETYRKI